MLSELGVVSDGVRSEGVKNFFRNEILFCFWGAFIGEWPYESHLIEIINSFGVFR
jgi:hypothetical protein